MCSSCQSEILTTLAIIFTKLMRINMKSNLIAIDGIQIKLESNFGNYYQFLNNNVLFLSIGDINDCHHYCHKWQTYDDQYQSKFGTSEDTDLYKVFIMCLLYWRPCLFAIWFFSLTDWNPFVGRKREQVCT